jgi:hypothetical protein
MVPTGVPARSKVTSSITWFIPEYSYSSACTAKSSSVPAPKARGLSAGVSSPTSAAGFSVRHADGATYGGPVRLPAVDIVRQVVGTLEHLGFKPTRARGLVDAALQAVAPDDAAQLLQAALRAS